MCCQAVADGIMSAWGCSAVFAMIETGDEEKLVGLCTSFIFQVDKMQEELDSLRNHPWAEMKAVSEAAGRIAKFCKCFLLLCNKAGSAASVQDVLYFQQYKGVLLFEKTVRNCLAADGVFKDQVAEVIKTAASSRSLMPKLTELGQVLAKQSWKQDDILRAMNLLATVQAGMRKGATDSESKSLMDRLCKMADETMACPHDVSEGLAGAISQGLEKFNDQPGILDKISQFSSFMTEHQGTLASNELSSYLEKVKAEREVSPGDLASILQKCDASTMVDSLLEKFDDLALDFLSVIAGKAGWVKSGERASLILLLVWYSSCRSCCCLLSCMPYAKSGE